MNRRQAIQLGAASVGGVTIPAIPTMATPEPLQPVDDWDTDLVIRDEDSVCHGDLEIGESVWSAMGSLPVHDGNPIEFQKWTRITREEYIKYSCPNYGHSCYFRVYNTTKDTTRYKTTIEHAKGWVSAEAALRYQLVQHQFFARDYVKTTRWLQKEYAKHGFGEKS